MSDVSFGDWRHDPRVVPLTEGSRGSGDRRGEVGLATFAPGVYPACSRHGALNRVGDLIWRCLAEGCNAGATVEGRMPAECLRSHQGE